MRLIIILALLLAGCVPKGQAPATGDYVFGLLWVVGFAGCAAGYVLCIKSISRGEAWRFYVSPGLGAGLAGFAIFPLVNVLIAAALGVWLLLWKRRGRAEEPFDPVDAWERNYLAWANSQSCWKCGAKASERERGPDGCALTWWVTENDCGCPGGPTPPEHDNRRMYLDAGLGP